MNALGTSAFEFRFPTQPPSPPAPHAPIVDNSSATSTAMSAVHITASKKVIMQLWDEDIRAAFKDLPHGKVTTIHRWARTPGNKARSWHLFVEFDRRDGAVYALDAQIEQCDIGIMHSQHRLYSHYAAVRGGPPAQLWSPLPKKTKRGARPAASLSPTSPAAPSTSTEPARPVPLHHPCSRGGTPSRPTSPAPATPTSPSAAKRALDPNADTNSAPPKRTRITREAADRELDGLFTLIAEHSKTCEETLVVCCNVGELAKRVAAENRVLAARHKAQLAALSTASSELLQMKAELAAKKARLATIKARGRAGAAAGQTE
ncbi:hypothetical protein BOTBODRAFT_375952 [Botryobasidium botryosum FD-172 SS1]|uniref:Uncharacterized protein n=1 Tax=Botryobasidium botryosum (strain FD-172 SS1) TaxID=930990 RepID=A0A067MVV9_BOTB1|nr:hypothetical protein BOTBODRAFT_375952 [Botryobasidium botryosum FD-172 SS1]